MNRSQGNLNSRRIITILLAAITLMLLVQGCFPTPTPEGLTPEVPSSTVTPTKLAATTVTPTITTTITPTKTPTPTPTKETQIAVITPDSQIRRLATAVFAGMNQPLSELTSDDVISLDPGGFLTTDQNGEAEILIAGCLKLFVFQSAELTRSTCRKSDAASGLGVCSTAGMVGVLNQCVSQVNIQNPSSSVLTQGTWFSVIYLPKDQLSIVQVYEGKVGVQAVVDPQSGKSTRGQSIPEGNLWFSSPGAEPPVINGISGRTPQPMEVWQALRPELIKTYPQLDNWMSAAKDLAAQEKLAFPDYLAPTQGDVIFHMVGPYWTDKNAQEGLLKGIGWADMMTSVSQEFNIAASIDYPKRWVADARLESTDLPTARKLISASGFDSSNYLISIITHATNSYEYGYAIELQKRLAGLGFPTELLTFSDEDLKFAIDQSSSGSSSPLIWLETSGAAFEAPQ